ncbi:MAG TPA: recombinase family protein [Terriglobales bacterium]|nr:recombinase family protein [Terriglobales bacterium]
MKTAAIYVRVSTADQHVESQLYDLRKLAQQRGLRVVREYEDRGISGSKARRPGLDALMVDARRKKFSVVLVAAFDRLARSTKHFLEVIDEFHDLGIEFISAREGIDSASPMGRFFTILVGCLAEAEKCMLVERIRSGMRRAKLEGKRLGRAPLQVNRALLLRDRKRGLSLHQLAKAHGISKASVCRVLKEEREAVSRSFISTDGATTQNEGVIPPISVTRACP